MGDYNDYPQRGSAGAHEPTVHLRVLEFHAVHHCNLACEGCSHFAPHAPHERVEVQRFQDSVTAAAARLTPTWVHLLGGEPLLHPGLFQLLVDLQQGFPDAARKLVTNGTLMAHADDRIYDVLADTRTAVAISVYPGVIIRPELIEERCRTHGIALEFWEQSTFLDFLDSSGRSDSREARLNCPMEGAANINDDRLFPCPVTAWGQFAGLPTGPAEGMPLSAAASELAWLLDRRRITSCCRFCRPRPARVPHRRRSATQRGACPAQAPNSQSQR